MKFMEPKPETTKTELTEKERAAWKEFSAKMCVLADSISKNALSPETRGAATEVTKSMGTLMPLFRQRAISELPELAAAKKA